MGKHTFGSVDIDLFKICVNSNSIHRTSLAHSSLDLLFFYFLVSSSEALFVCFLYTTMVAVESRGRKV